MKEKELTLEEMQKKIEEREVQKDQAFADAYKALCQEHKRELRGRLIIIPDEAPAMDYGIIRHK